MVRLREFSQHETVAMILLWLVAPILLSLYLQATKSVLRRGPRHVKLARERARAQPASAEDDAAKCGWSARKVPAELDAIVIGSGIGGLATAALLARAGQRVLVLEQHDVAGGCCHTFEENASSTSSAKQDETVGQQKPSGVGKESSVPRPEMPSPKFTYEFDTGLHYVGDHVGSADPVRLASSGTRKLFDAISDGAIEWDAMSAHFDHAIVGKAGASKREVFKMHAKYSYVKEELESRFPQQKEAVARYFELLEECKAASVRHLAPRLVPVGRWLDRALVRIMESAPVPTAAAVGVCKALRGALYLARGAAWLALGHPLHLALSARFRALSQMTVAHALRHECGVTDKRLAGMLAYAWGDAGLPPAQLSFATHAMIANHYAGGGYYPRGGPAVIARAVIPVIERAGGAVLVRARVERILVEPSATSVPLSSLGCRPLEQQLRGLKAVGVRVRGTDVRAPVIVSAIGARAAHALLQQSVPSLPPLPSGLPEQSVSMLSLFVGLRGSSQELQLPSANLWCFPSWRHDDNWRSFSEVASNGTAAALAPPKRGNWPATFISFSSAKDSLWQGRRGACSVAMVLAPVYYAPFARFEEGTRVKHRGAEYEGVKRALTNALLQELFDQLPHLRDRVEVAELGTPLSNNFYLGTRVGEVYGMAAQPERWADVADAWTRCDTEVEGLYCAGQDALSPGVAGAAQSALFVLAAMGPQGLWDNLNILV